MSGHAEMYELLGLRPIVVEGLHKDAILVDDEGIILIDQDADRDGVARWALAYCAHVLATHPS